MKKAIHEQSKKRSTKMLKKAHQKRKLKSLKTGKVNEIRTPKSS